MKDYNQVFTCELPVQLLADKLYQAFMLNVPLPIHRTDSDASIGKTEAQESYDKDVAYYTKVTESIMDNLADNGTACADIFNTMNGWVKTETPLDKTIPAPTVAQNIGVDSIVIFHVDDANMENSINKLIDVEWIRERDRELIGKVVRCCDSGKYKVYAPCVDRIGKQGEVYYFIEPASILATRNEEFYHNFVTSHLPELISQLNRNIQP